MEGVNERIKPQAQALALGLGTVVGHQARRAVGILQVGAAAEPAAGTGEDDDPRAIAAPRGLQHDRQSLDHLHVERVYRCGRFSVMVVMPSCASKTIVCLSTRFAL